MSNLSSPVALALWQPPLLPVMTNLASWWLSNSNDVHLYQHNFPSIHWIQHFINTSWLRHQFDLCFTGQPVIIPPAVYWFHSVRPSVRPSALQLRLHKVSEDVRPSVCPSVRPSVPHAVSALYHLQLWMDSFHIRHKWSLPWEGVSRTMTFDLDLYLQGRSALT